MFPEIKQKLSSGNFGTVWIVEMEGKEFAMKTVKQSDEFVNREESIMKQISHPHIIGYVKSWVQDSTLHLVMECEPTNLKEYIKYNSFTSDELKTVTRGMFSGVEYLHSKSICHRDLKLDNILYNPQLVKVKICDFGCSKIMEENKPNTSYICSRYYRAPELIIGAEIYSTSIDIWSLGCIIAEITTKVPLFRGCDSIHHQLAEIIKVLGMPSSYDCYKMNVKRFRFSGEIKTRKLIDVLCHTTPFELIDLLSKIFVYDPTKRYTASKALEHKYYSNTGLLEKCLQSVRDDGDSPDKIEEHIRQLYTLMKSKHEAEMEIQEKVHSAQYKAFIDSPIEKGSKKWSSPIAGVFSRGK